MNKPKRIFVDAPYALRCKHDTILKDKSKAQCGRYKIYGHDYCKQHQKMVELK